MSFYNRDSDQSGGVVTIMHSGLCEQYFKSLELSSSGFDIQFRTLPHELWPQAPPELLFIITRFVMFVVL